MLSRLLKQTALVVAVLSTLPVMVRADGGLVLWQQKSGPLTVTAFTSQAPLRIGPADLSFLIENDEQARPILDARVSVVFEDAGGAALRGEATHDQARNKLLYCSVLNLVRAGQERMKVSVIDGNQKYDLVSDVQVAGPPSPLIAHWKVLTFPFIVAILFVFHQRLAWKKPS